uniref:Uncharacterized protein n=1 Tax=Wuchereria bancrofti TaxID=6293 RepID=A0AAF5PP11_WUCBA
MSIRNWRTFPASHNFHYCVDDSSSIVCIRITSATVILCDTIAVRTDNFLLWALNSCANSSAHSAATSKK